MIQTVENDRVARFPCICPHCDLTYWVRPNDLITEMPQVCQDALRALWESGQKDQGRAFWGTLWDEAVQRGKEMAASNG